MAVPIEDAIEIMDFAVAQNNEDKLFQRWIVQSQFEMSFDEFKQAVMPAVNKSDEEVLKDVFSIIEMMNKETNNGTI